jgi:hypothetical protein
MQRKPYHYKFSCVEKILSMHSGIDVMLELTDYAFDIFIQSLKNENPNITQEEINEKIREMIRWKKDLESRTRKETCH